MTGRQAKLAGVFTATGQSDPVAVVADFNVSLWVASGSPTATIRLQRSPDGGTSWRNVDAKDGGAYGSTAEERGFEPASGYLYRFDCTALSGGTVGYEINN